MSEANHTLNKLRRYQQQLSLRRNEILDSSFLYRWCKADELINIDICLDMTEMSILDVLNPQPNLIAEAERILHGSDL